MSTTDCPVHGLGGEFDPFAGDSSAWYAFMRRAREEEPVFYSPVLDYWVVTRWDDVMAVLHDSETYSSANTLVQIKPPCPAALQVMGEYGIEPGRPVARRRSTRPSTASSGRLFRKSFTPERVAALEPRIDRAHRPGDRSHHRPRRGGRRHRPRVGRAGEDRLRAHGRARVRGREDQDRDRAAGDDGLGRALRRGAGRARDGDRGVLALRAGADRPARRRTRARTSWATSSAPGRSRATRTCSAATSSAGSSSTRCSPATRRRRTPPPPGSARCSPTAISGRRSARTRRSSPTRSRRSCASTHRCPTWRRVTTRATTLGGVELPEGANLLVGLGSANHDEGHFRDGERFDVRRDERLRPARVLLGPAHVPRRAAGAHGDARLPRADHEAAAAPGARRRTRSTSTRPTRRTAAPSTCSSAGTRRSTRWRPQQRSRRRFCASRPATL